MCASSTDRALASLSTNWGSCIEGPLQMLGEYTLALSRASGEGEKELIETCRMPSGLSVRDDALQPDAAFLALDHLATLAIEYGGWRQSEEIVQGMLARSRRWVLAYRRLLDLVEPLLFRGRPVYVEVHDDLGSPKGRVHEGNLLLAEALGWPVVRCSYDDVTMDTPVLRVVRAALHAIVSDHVPLATPFARGLQAAGHHAPASFVTHLAHRPGRRAGGGAADLAGASRAALVPSPCSGDRGAETPWPCPGGR